MFNRSVSNGDGGRERGSSRPSFQENLQRGGCGSRRGGRAERGGTIAPTQINAQKLSGFIKSFLDILRALSAKFEGGQGGGRPTMPVEPGGGIGDGAGPIPGGDSGPIPVEPDGGIGDGAGPIPPEATTLAIGEEDGGSGPIPVEPGGGIGDGAGPIPPDATTLAIGEEDGGGDGGGPFPIDPDGPFPPEATTLAIGEEDGGGFLDPVFPIDKGGPEFTTLALGEEDGGEAFIPVEPDGGIGDGAGPPPFIVDGEERFPVEPGGGIGDGAGPPDATTLALGEEDGGFGLDTVIDAQELPTGKSVDGGKGRGRIPFNDLSNYGRHKS